MIDPERWRAVRRHLNAHRPELTDLALRLYPHHLRVEGTPLLARPEWLPRQPVEVDRVALDWRDDAPPPAFAGDPGYAEVVRRLARPRFFEDRTCYRLLDVRWSPAPRLAWGRGRYFDIINGCEAVAHELAGRHLQGQPLQLDHLPLRAAIGDPLDPGRRAMLPAITALTLRRGPEPTFVLHWRDPARVASGGGLYQVLPVGVFQPSGEAAGRVRGDLDLWRSMAREYGEELLGEPEHRDVSYESWPFWRRLEAARAGGRVRAHCLGLGVDPLTAVTDLLVAVVFEPDAFDVLFETLPTANDEGRIEAHVPFTEDGAGDLPLQPAGAAVLRLAWRHRDALRIC
jgi:hypothetical protein